MVNQPHSQGLETLMPDELLTLTAGRLRLVLNPGTGGSVHAFEWVDGAEVSAILRASSENTKDVLAAANFPLVPYVNRVRDGRFDFRGRSVQLTVNMPGDPSPLHGQGWLGAWDVESVAERHAELIFKHQAGEWPWEYEARQRFRLHEPGLSLTLTCKNLSDEPMPCGLGQHPYFPCTSETVLDTQVDSAWTIDEKVLPVAQVPARGRYGLHNRRICGQDLDNGFSGWGGEARMSDPSWPYSIRMSSSSARFFQVYSPAAGGIFVAEPVSHANAALNAPEAEWAALGMKVLEPGEQASLDMRIEVVANAGAAG